MCNCKQNASISANPLLASSLSIPDQIRGDVAEVVDRTRATLSFTRPDIEYLFQVYNRYIAREPEDVNCGACRTKVVGKLRVMVDEWKKRGYLDA